MKKIEVLLVMMNIVLICGLIFAFSEFLKNKNILDKDDVQKITADVAKLKTNLTISEMTNSEILSKLKEAEEKIHSLNVEVSQEKMTNSELLSKVDTRGELDKVLKVQLEEEKKKREESLNNFVNVSRKLSDMKIYVNELEKTREESEKAAEELKKKTEEEAREGIAAQLGTIIIR